MGAADAVLAGRSGVSLAYARAVGVTSVDRDLKPEIGNTVDTEWHRISAGIKLRVTISALASSIWFVRAGDRACGVRFRPHPVDGRSIPRGRYLFVYGRASGRVDFTYFGGRSQHGGAVSGSIGGRRQRSARGQDSDFGEGLSGSSPLERGSELEMGISYSVVSFGLRPLSVPGRNDESGTVIDQSRIGTFGPRFWF